MHCHVDLKRFPLTESHRASADSLPSLPCGLVSNVYSVQDQTATKHTTNISCTHANTHTALRLA